MALKTFIVPKTYQNYRLDLYLTCEMDEMSRTMVKHHIKSNLVRVNKKIEYHANYKVQPFDEIDIQIEHKKKGALDLKAQKIDLDIVYEDENLIAVNKASGMVVHPASGNFEGTLVNALLYKYKFLSQVGQTFRAGLINRIDKDTSGIVLVGKNNKALWFFSRQFAQREADKYYLAVVKGDFSKVVSDNNQIRVKNYIDRNPIKRKKYSVSKKGKGRIAITTLKLVAVSADQKYSLVLAKPETGRTHQIRVHLGHLGFAIVGDPIYNTQEYKRLLLHSHKLQIFNLDSTKLEIEAPLDNEFKEFLGQNFKKSDVEKYI